MTTQTLDPHGRQIALMKFLAKSVNQMGVGEHVYVVGGAVRNFVIGEKIKDLDIVVDSVALRGKDSDWVAKQLQRKIPAVTNLTTNQYGVAIMTVKTTWILEGHDLQGEVLEIANARKESYGKAEGKGYKPDAVVPATIHEDIVRREFRFNTLLWRMSELASGPDKAEILDLTGCGLSDLKAGVMRCPSDPDVVFGDDPTRIIRLIKFSVKYGFKPDAETLAAAKRQLPKLWNVPHNAVGTLLIDSVLVEPTARKALDQLQDLGALDVIAKMMRKIPAFQAQMMGWMKSQRVQLLFEALDMGLPVDEVYRFLRGDMQKRYRDLVFSLSDKEAKFLGEVLKQPGIVLDTKALIEQFSLQGSEIRTLTTAAQDILLDDPGLLHKPQEFTEAVELRLALK